MIYLAMILDFSTPGVLKVDMTRYVKDMVSEFPEELKVSAYPWIENLFKVDPESGKLSKTKAEQFHTFVAKGLFVASGLDRIFRPRLLDWLVS